MMTSKNISQAKISFRSFINSCLAYKALLIEHELPLSIDMEELTGALRAQLFAKLLAVDAGLKMRFDMLRTEDAQQQLINNTIDLAGYSIVPQLKQFIAQLNKEFDLLGWYEGPHWMSMKMRNSTLGWLLHGYDLDIEQWLETERIDWTGRVAVLAYFTDMAIRLTQLRKLHQVTRNDSAGLHEIVRPSLAGYFIEEGCSGSIEPNEYTLMSELIPRLEEAGKLADFPNSLA
ncbi:hypothetical protein FY528_09000 [Hymenobacter lutimineralis]|uniref:Uncharacterized protein n=1 Tax=Hymenobacter lutimineralis TaxID=2606448 RepID=A0A5D6V6W5_9BACT|nr:hypothetical protein [Hymenobacter lutimineralis]TYZ10589.1 hypothetical protein FY528_09000 [Hymenobacter lutimineralis]